MNTINHHLLSSTVSAHNSVNLAGRQLQAKLDERRSTMSERGEGVISVALAVLIMAGLAGLMWVAYKQMFEDASKKAADGVSKIG
jgi:hypothetical protein